jgi:hypothetical protein
LPRAASWGDGRAAACPQPLPRAAGHSPKSSPKPAPKGKRKRGQAASSSGDGKPEPKPRFNTTVRCSLKEIAACIALLKDRHLKVLDKADLGHLKDFKIKSNISRSLGCFLMYHIDPTSMILDLGGNKKLEITAEVIYKLFALPRGNDSPPRPSEEYVIPLRDLKDELGIVRHKDLE